MFSLPRCGRFLSTLHRAGQLTTTLDVHHGRCNGCRSHVRQLSSTQRFCPRDTVQLGMDAEKACVHVCLARWAMWPVGSPTHGRTWTRARTGLEAHGNFHVVHFPDLGELDDSLLNGDMPPSLWIRPDPVWSTPRPGQERRGYLDQRLD